MSKASILRDLRVQFGNASRIKLSQAASVMGYSPATARNKVQAGTFPVEVQSERGQTADPKNVRHHVVLNALATFLAGLENASVVPTGHRRVGRPNKTEELQRRLMVQAAQGGAR